MIRLACSYMGETHMYVYPPEETYGAAKAIARHVMEGRLHPAAGIVLCRMLEGDDDGG